MTSLLDRAFERLPPAAQWLIRNRSTLFVPLLNRLIDKPTKPA